MAIFLANKRRSRTEIVTDILRVASGRGTSITALVYRSNSNFNRTRKYVEMLLRRNLLERSDSSSSTYRTTPKGEAAMKILTDLDQIVFGAGDPATAQFRDSSESPRLGFFAGDWDSDAIRMSFARLSSVCKHKDGKTCKLSGCECRLKNCPVPLIREPEGLVPV
jgi:predicted transcriptional regulator